MSSAHMAVSVGRADWSSQPARTALPDRFTTTSAPADGSLLPDQWTLTSTPQPLAARG